MKFLIADDYPANRKLLRAQLEGEGHSVIEVADGLEALRILRHETVDALISDILMPNMDGFKLCQAIRSDSKLYQVPVILFTSTYNSPSDKQLAETVGADLYLQKPCPTATLLASVKEAQKKALTHKPQQPAEANEQEDKYILEKYNDALVRKLEERNDELQAAIGFLEAARDEIMVLNRNLDVRVKQRTEDLAAANEELEAFSASVSHDLRAPLRNLRGFVHLLEDPTSGSLSPTGKELITKILTSAKYMDSLITGLLAFSHANRSEMKARDVDLEALLDETIKGIEPECAGRRVEWQRQPLPHVYGDAVLLRQVLVNLLSNAVKYTRPRDLARIEIGCRDERTENVMVYVRDNGVGFDMQQATNLFGIFRRLHRADQFEGTGIGLANARRIVNRHGGKIWAESEIGRGSTFYFTLQRANQLGV